MNKKLNFLWVAILLIFAMGCQPSPQIETNPKAELTPGSLEALPQATADLPAVEPEAGKATVTGQVITTKTNGPLKNTVVRLAEVHRDGEDGAFLLDTAFSPGDITNDEGQFTFANIEPGEYVLVVGNVEFYDGYVIIPETSGRPKVYNFPAGQLTDLGSLTVDLEPQS